MARKHNPRNTSGSFEGAAAAPARARKTRTARTTPETAAEPVAPALAAEMAAPAQQPEDAHAAIARLAYSYWEARGYQGGSPEEDWFRAEQEYRARTNASR
ncbi:MAG: DUF2934 domain-containing protein [Bryobacterales bacterium]|nr:DUF2934 domain-containing protein [Bryobacterales bacterium]